MILICVLNSNFDQNKIRDNYIIIASVIIFHNVNDGGYYAMIITMTFFFFNKIRDDYQQ